MLQNDEIAEDLIALRAGDHEAFSALVRRYHRRMLVVSECEARENFSKDRPASTAPDELLITSEIDCLTTLTQKFRSNVAREALYLINHTIHHAAYIRLLLKGCGIELASHIGIAPCTATFQRESQQATIESSACAL